MSDMNFQDNVHLMGIVNVTPDSFSDGGQFVTASSAIEHGLSLIEEGASIVDIGGESTRPGAEPISMQQEIDRVIPVVEGLCESGAIISIDTRHAGVMEEALKAGASMINDVTALSGEGAIDVAKNAQHICLMHMQGMPQNMQDNPNYDDVVQDIYAYFESRINQCSEAGIDKGRLIVDPGIGFGKTLQHNLKIISQIGRFHDLGVSVMLGASRKSFIAKICNDVPADQRLAGSLAAVLAGLDRGVKIFRVHDVAETRQAIEVWQAIQGETN